jgi:hypothetical protein
MAILGLDIGKLPQCMFGENLCGRQRFRNA